MEAQVHGGPGLAGDMKAKTSKPVVLVPGLSTNHTVRFLQEIVDWQNNKARNLYLPSVGELQSAS